MNWKIAFTIAAGLGLLYALFTVGMPFLLAIVIAIFLETPVLALMKGLKLNRIAASTIVCTVFLLVLFGVAYWIGAGAVAQLLEFINKMPVYLDEVSKYFNETVAKTQLLYNSLPEDVAAQVQSGLREGIQMLVSLLKDFAGSVSSFLLGAAKALPSLFVAFIVFLVALYMFSFSLPTLKTQFINLFEERSRGKVENVLGNLRNSIFGFLRAQFIMSGLTYIISLAGLLILDVNYAMAIALMIVLVDILPILGTGSFIVPWAIYLLIKGEIGIAIGLIVLFLILTVFRRTIEPKVLGDSIGISPLSTLVSLYVGFELMGVIGLFFGPIVVMIYQAMRRVGLLQFKFKLE